ncbi:MAG: hypothetical protein ABH950_00105 [Candidatus Altiarchaeota archaeon]
MSPHKSPGSNGQKPGSRSTDPFRLSRDLTGPLREQEGVRLSEDAKVAGARRLWVESMGKRCKELGLKQVPKVLFVTDPGVLADTNLKEHRNEFVFGVYSESGNQVGELLTAHQLFTSTEADRRRRMIEKYGLLPCEVCPLIYNRREGACAMVYINPDKAHEVGEMLPQKQGEVINHHIAKILLGHSRPKPQLDYAFNFIDRFRVLKEAGDEEGLKELTEFILKGARDLGVDVLESMALPPVLPGSFDQEVREKMGVNDAFYPKEGLGIAAAILFSQPNKTKGVTSQEPQEFSISDLNDIEVMLATSYFDPHGPLEAIEFCRNLAKAKNEDPDYLNRIANRRRDILNITTIDGIGGYKPPEEAFKEDKGLKSVLAGRFLSIRRMNEAGPDAPPEWTQILGLKK